MSIATKTGDNGTTGLMFNRRVPKTDARVAAYGACDELNAALGIVRAYVDDSAIADAVFTIQKELVILMGELATDAADRARYVEKGFSLVDEAMVERLTGHVDDLEKNHKISFQHWATPGATRESAHLDVARTVCRRAERETCVANEGGFPISPLIIRYLNRLSDLLWLWARWFETKRGLAV
jgi:cob(I)alamin adenosyltransferase